MIAKLKILLLFFFAFTFSYADVGKGMDMMWTQTNPSVGASNGNYGGQLGGVSLRSPIRSFQFVAYDAPRFQAGCGGIDAQFGSFSMMSLDNMRNIMRAIMSNAGGYAAKVALDNLCTRCQGIMSSMQDVTTKLNGAAKNTCQIGSHLVDAARGETQLGSLWKGDGKAIWESVQSAAKGISSDFFAANEKTFKNGNNANRPDNAAEINTVYGNNMMNTLSSTGVFGGGNGNSAVDTEPYGGDRGFLEMAMNLYGTNINLTGANARSEASGGEFTKGSSQRSDKKFYPLWSFDDLVKGEPENGVLNGYSCADFNIGKADSCQNVAVKPVKWSGTRKYVAGLLAGGSSTTADGWNRTIAPDSIMAYLADNNVQLDQKRRQYLAALPPETRAALSDVAASGNTQLMVLIVDYASDMLGEQMAAEMLQAMNKTVSQAYSANVAGGKDIAAPSAQLAAQLDKLRDTASNNLAKSKMVRNQADLQRQARIMLKLNGYAE